MTTKLINNLAKQLWPVILELETNYRKRQKDFYTAQTNKTIDKEDLRSIFSIPCDAAPISKLTNILKNADKIVYSYDGLRLQYIFSLKNTLIGSDPRSLHRLKQFVKFQAVAHYNDIFQLDQVTMLLYLTIIAYQGILHINNNITFNDDANGLVYYDPINNEKIKTMCVDVCNEILNDEMDVLDFNDVPHTLRKDYIFMKQKRATKEDIEKLIEQFETKPSINQLVEAYNAPIDQKLETIEDADEFIATNATKMSYALMRKYIIEFCLEDRTSMAKYKNKDCPMA